MNATSENLTATTSISLSLKQDAKFLQNLQHKNVFTLLEFIISHTSPPMLRTELLDCDLREGTFFIGEGVISKVFTNWEGSNLFYPQPVVGHNFFWQGKKFLHVA